MTQADGDVAAVARHTCVLARDGRGIALTESHATWLRWLG